MIKKLLLPFLLLLFSTRLSAQETEDTIVRKYNADEEWFVQAQIGYSYLAAENTRYVDFGKIAKPEYTLSIGKRFTPIWGARFQGQWGDDTGVFYGHDSQSPTYDFSHSSFNLIGSFNISEYLQRTLKYGYNKRFNITALLGLGAAFTKFDNTVDLSTEQFLDKQGKSFLSLFAGVEAAYSINPSWDISLELGSHWMGKKYNGMIIERFFWLKKIDQSIPLLLGLRYTFNKPRRKFGPSKRVEYVPVPVEEVVEVKDYGTREILEREEDCFTVEELIELSKQRIDIRGRQLCCGESVLFDYGKADLKVFSTLYLDKIVELLQMHPVNIVMKGLGGKHANTYLTDRRMKAIRDYLAERGIEYDRIVYQYVPVGTPCVDNLNIRLEIMEYPTQGYDDCYEIDELLDKANHGEPIREMNICSIDMVHFDNDKDIIKPAFAKYLNKLAKLMMYSDINILIMGHTDSNGSVDYNYDLSERRAKAVLNYLHSKGIAYNRMKFSYYSKLIPYTENATEHGRSINRRCELITIP